MTTKLTGADLDKDWHGAAAYGGVRVLDRPVVLEGWGWDYSPSIKVSSILVKPVVLIFASLF